MQDKFITSALRHLRAQCVREGKPSLEHVEALLQLRGDNLGPVPKKKRQAFKRNESSRAVLAILREGPQSRRRIAERLVKTKGNLRQGLVCAASTALQKLKRVGVVERVVGAWRVRAQP